MNMSRRSRSEAMARARKAHELLATPIEYDEHTATSEGHDTVERGLEIMAAALSEMNGLDLGSAPLDRVLAEVGEGVELVEMAAQLIERIGRASYSQLSRDDVDEAEELRRQLYDAVAAVLDALEARDDDG